MAKTAYINARVDKKVKADAQKVLKKLGLTITEAIEIFLRQIVLRRGIPFEIEIPKIPKRS